MIDWLNFWIEAVFMFAGLVFLVKAVSEDELTLTCVFLGGFFLFFPFFIIETDVSFDSALHECTEWKSAFLQEGNEYVKAQEANAACMQGCPNYPIDDAISCQTGCFTKHLYQNECVVFREKTRAELDADFCKGNPTDTTRCYCVEIKNSTLRKGTDLMERDFFNSESELQALLVKHGDRVEGGCIFTSEENFGCSTFDVLNKYLKGKVVKGSVDYRGYREFNFSVCVGAVPKVGE